MHLTLPVRYRQPSQELFALQGHNSCNGADNYTVYQQTSLSSGDFKTAHCHLIYLDVKREFTVHPHVRNPTYSRHFSHGARKHDSHVIGHVTSG